MKNYLKFRKEHWIDQVKKSSKYNINNFILNPYTYLKSKFYVEGSSLLILICIKLGVKPNTITAIYALLGLIGGILLCIPNDTCNVIGVIIFFSKGIVDWTDGGVAKIINQISKFGGLFDAWAGRFGHISFIVGLGFYLYAKNNEVYFLFLLIVLLASYSTSIKILNLQVNDIDMLKKKNNIKIIKKKSKKIHISLFNKVVEILKNSFDDRARSVDLICLLILINLKFDILVILNFIFYFITLRFIASSARDFQQIKTFYK